MDGKGPPAAAGLVNWNKQIQTTLARRGIVLVDAPYVTIDLASAELVVPTPSVPHDPEVLAELDRGARLGPELPYVRPGRYPIATWYLNRSPDEIGPLAPALGVASAYGLVSTESDPLVIGAWAGRTVRTGERSGRLAGPSGGPRRAAGPGPPELTPHRAQAQVSTNLNCV